MHRYKWTCRPLSSCLAGRCIRGPERLATFSLRSNVNSTVPDNLNRYDRKQLPRLSLREMLSSPACIVSRASEVLASLQCQYYSTGFFKQIRMTEESSWVSPFTGGLVAQCDGDALALLEYQFDAGKKGLRSVAVALCTLRHWMHLRFNDNPCLLHIALSFWPIRCVRTQNNNFWKYISCIYISNRKKNLDWHHLCGAHFSLPQLKLKARVCVHISLWESPIHMHLQGIHIIIHV